MNELVILVPSLGRPDTLAGIAQAFADTSPPHRLLFIADFADVETRFEAVKHGELLVMPPGERGHPKKINKGIAATKEPLIFLAADDVKPWPNWFELSSQHISDTIGVVSLNDLGNRSVIKGRLATFPLIARWYIDKYGPYYHEGYRHNCADVEASECAQKRGAFYFERQAIMEHLHFLWGKSAPGIDGIDQTYKDWAINEEGIAHDRALLEKRRALWA